MTSSFPIEIQRIEKCFGRRRALGGVDLQVNRAEITGLVGPNGSGKTTLLKLVAGLLQPTRGTVRVFGLDPFRDQAQVMQRTRFAFAPPALFETLTPIEHLQHLVGIRSASMPAVTQVEIDAVLDLVGLRQRANDRVRTFSFGMRQRLVLAQALLPRPELLVLDEPTDGLDPLAVLELRDILLQLRDSHNMSILLSSHLLVEIEQLVDRILVLTQGESIFWGRPSKLTAGMQCTRLEVSDSHRALELLRQNGYVGVAREDGSIELQSDGLRLDDARLLLGDDIELRSFHTHRPRLEEALLLTLRKQHDSQREGEGS